MTFNRKVNRCGAGPYSMECIGVDFLSVDMVSNSDFDAAHMAGVSLGDVATFTSTSLKPYIESGYLLPCSGDTKCIFSVNCSRPVEKFLSQLYPDDLTLLPASGIGRLAFSTRPTISKNHTFAVTVSTVDGRVFEASIDMEFE